MQIQILWVKIGSKNANMRKIKFRHYPHLYYKLKASTNQGNKKFGKNQVFQTIS